MNKARQAAFLTTMAEVDTRAIIRTPSDAMKNKRPVAFARILTVLALLHPLLIPCQEPRTKDFSSTNVVSILLGDVEHGTGLEHLDKERDGRTESMSLDGVPCRYLNLKPRSLGYLYFVLDPTFKEADVANVRIDVEYFDGFEGQTGSFDLQYDATKDERTLEASYTRANETARLNGSKKWKTATFHVRGASFQNSQNGHSDFRLRAFPPELYVRRVTVTREPARGAIPRPTPLPKEKPPPA